MDTMTQRWLSRRSFIASTALLTSSALMMACGGSSEESLSPSDSNVSSPVASAEGSSASPTVVDSGPVGTSKDTITFPIIANPGTLNPIKVASTAEVQVARVIHTSLVRLDPFNFEPQPDLAVSWEVSEDGLTWTFNLRDDVKFHDGTAFTAEDVKFTMDRMLDPEINSARGRQFLLIEETEVVDPYTVTFRLQSPWSALPTILAGRWAAAPKHLLEDVDIATDTTYDKEPVGVGPYKVVEWVPADHITLQANVDFYRGEPKIKTLIFKVIPDSNVQIAQLRTGEIDAIPFFADASLPAVKGHPDIEVDQGWGSVWYAVHLNMNRTDLFGDVKVRQALSYAIDREGLIANLLGGSGTVATGPIIPQIEWAYNGNVRTYPYDPEKAKALLREAGWTEQSGGWTKDGTTLSLTLSAFTGNATVEQAATLIQQYWTDIGVNTEIEVLEFSTFITEVRDNRGPDGYYTFVSYMTPEPEPDGIYAYFHSSNAERGSNFTAYKNPEVDALLEMGREETNREKRREAYAKVQEILAEDQTRIFLFYPPTNLVRRKTLKGLPPVDSYAYIEQAYFE